MARDVLGGFDILAASDRVALILNDDPRRGYQEEERTMRVTRELAIATTALGTARVTAGAPARAAATTGGAYQL